MRAIFLVGSMVWGLLGAQAMAEGPAAPPPPGYQGRDFTDSDGCRFQRVTVGGRIVWAPLLAADGRAVCAPVAEAAVPAPSPTPEAAPVTERAVPRQVRKGQAPTALVGHEAVPASDSLCLRDRGEVARVWISDGRRVTLCAGREVVTDAGAINGLGVPGLTVTATRETAAGLAAAKARGAGGYRVIWSNGPLSGRPLSDRPLSDRAPLAAGALWVQVGAFADAANVTGAVARLKAADLPAARQPVRGGSLTAVLAGPFATLAEAEKARQTLQSAGFAGAFVRR